MDLDCGPVINARQRGRVQSFIDQSREAGIPVIALEEFAVTKIIVHKHG